MITFIKKEFTELIRTGRLYILMAVFFCFGIMNPLMAKLTPTLLKSMADSMEASGIIIGEVTVTAADSWTQYYKNLPILLIVFVLMYAGVFTREYSKGTLINIVTKGISRTKIYLSKAITMIACFSFLYWMYYLITYGYTCYLWDNSVVINCGFAALLYWIFGAYLIGAMLLFSAIAHSTTGVLLGTGVFVLVPMFMGLIPKLTDKTPNYLMSGMSILSGKIAIADTIFALVVTGIILILSVIIGKISFSKYKL